MPPAAVFSLPKVDEFCFSAALVRRNVAAGSVDSGTLVWSKVGIRNAKRSLEPRDSFPQGESPQEDEL